MKMEQTLRKGLSTLYQQQQLKPLIAFCGAGGASSVASMLLGTPGASNCILDVKYPYSRESLLEYLGVEDLESYCDPKTTNLAARVAQAKAFQYSFSKYDAKFPCIGVACMGALKSNYARRGADRAYISLFGSDGQEINAYVSFRAGGNLSRQEQDWITSAIVIDMICQTFSESFESILPSIEENPDVELVVTRVSGIANESIRDAVRLLESNPLISYVMCVPGSDYDWRIHVGWEVPAGSVPTGKDLILIPGSFNPLHVGHRRLAKVVNAKMPGKRSIFEIALKNIDKGEIDPNEVSWRVDQFMDFMQDPNKPLAPTSVVITKAPKFIEKAKLFPKCTFALGYDTATRLIDQKYYNDRDAMFQAMQDLNQLGCSFVVAGRIETATNTFKEFSEIQEGIPTGLQSMFHALTEKEFRIDVSSTELRLISPRSMPNTDLQSPRFC